MKISLQRLIPITFSLLFLAACATQAIHKVDNVSFGYYTKKSLTIEQIRESVERAATRTGWQLSNEKPGFYTGKREWGGGKHNIVVDVVYNKQSFSIKYRDSYQMKYDGSWIHNTYNRMVEKLEEDIKTAVATL